jgi:hypothetical protein
LPSSNSLRDKEALTSQQRDLGLVGMTALLLHARPVEQLDGEVDKFIYQWLKHDLLTGLNACFSD